MTATENRAGTEGRPEAKTAETRATKIKAARAKAMMERDRASRDGEETGQPRGRPRPGGKPGRPLWRTVALPAERGGWGIALEPIALGLLVAPSVTGFFLALAALGSFLVRTPLKIAWTDLRRGQRLPRTRLALQFLLLYGALVVVGFAAAFLTGGLRPLLPLLAASPVTGLQLYYDLFSSARQLLPELAGPVALSSVAGGIALARGWSWPAALALWAVPGLRTMPTVLYVRARVRLERNIPVSIAPAILVHVLAAVAGLALTLAGLIPRLAALGLLILLARTVYGLSSHRKPITTKALGWSEVRLGVLYTLLAAVGYWTGL